MSYHWYVKMTDKTVCVNEQLSKPFSHNYFFKCLCIVQKKNIKIFFVQKKYWNKIIVCLDRNLFEFNFLCPAFSSIYVYSANSTGNSLMSFFSFAVSHTCWHWFLQYRLQSHSRNVMWHTYALGILFWKISSKSFSSFLF